MYRLRPNFFLSIPLLALPALWPQAAAQSGALPFRIEATHKQAVFWVDGTMYRGSAAFSWPEGSNHTLEVRDIEQYTTSIAETRFVFRQWKDPANQTNTLTASTIVVTASRSTPVLQLEFQTQYLVQYLINGGQPAPGYGPCYRRQSDDLPEAPPAHPMGFVTVGGQGGANCVCVHASTFDWVNENSSLVLNAVARPNYAFVDFQGIPELSSGSFGQVIVNRPLKIRINFGMARRVTFESVPTNALKILIDRAEFQTRYEGDTCFLRPDPDPNPGPLPRSCAAISLCTGERDLLPGSQHLLSAPLVQNDRGGKPWVFDHWEGDNITGNPGLQYIYTVPQEFRSHSVRAHFVPGVNVYFTTQPRGLKLTVDGRNNWWFNGFTWGVGHKHTFSAPLEQTDSQGRRYIFKGWSNGGPAEQEFVPQADMVGQGVTLHALYEPVGQVTITSDPANILVLAGSEQCRTPCTLYRDQGTQETLYVMDEEYLSEDAKIRFEGWKDGETALQRNIIFDDTVQRLHLSYRMMYRLRLLSDPDEGASFSLSPPGDGQAWFPAGEEVLVTVESRPGYKFRRWDGVLAGTIPTGSVTMSSPATVVARLDKVPELREGAVRNAADRFPGPGVAPGSLIAIDGYNLANEAETGPTFPLRQTLQGVTVQAGDRVLPLISVSPETIIALLPSDMRLGEHKLIVRTPGQADLTTKFQVVRNAPGLFCSRNGDVSMLRAFHEDGSAVTPDKPARRGQIIRILGTGFGPLQPLPPDGFPTPDSPEYRLRDASEVFVNGVAHQPESVSAAPGLHGVVWVRVRLAADLPGGQMMPVTAVANGVSSNTASVAVD
jgi:uncharacterized protein (TIGR03437 family)